MDLGEGVKYVLMVLFSFLLFLFSYFFRFSIKVDLAELLQLERVLNSDPEYLQGFRK